MLLVAEEAMHNVLRHAHSTEVYIEFERDNHSVVSPIKDNGIGFDPTTIGHGHGIAGMRSRAERFGGKLLIQASIPGSTGGTTLEFRIPV